VTDDWTDVLSALSASGARFLVVGAHAMAVHGVPRGTQDLDVPVRPQSGVPGGAGVGEAFGDGPAGEEKPGTPAGQGEVKPAA